MLHILLMAWEWKMFHRLGVGMETMLEVREGAESDAWTGIEAGNRM